MLTSHRGLAVLFVFLLLFTGITAFVEDFYNHLRSKGVHIGSKPPAKRKGYKSASKADLKKLYEDTFSGKNVEDPNSPYHGFKWTVNTDHDVCPFNQTAPAVEAHSLHAVDGCGPAGRQVTDDYGLHRCCNSHDLCYTVCNTAIDYCENEFVTCMLKICSRFQMEKAIQCSNQADVFASTTRKSALKYHPEMQNEVCSCYSTPEFATARHESYLLQLYQNHNKSHALVSDVRETLTEHKGREHELYFALLKSYGGKAVQLNDQAKDEF